MEYYLGRRLSYDNNLCTVRFHGPLAGTKGQWLGVEWDNPARGKHNGQHQGQQIFECQSGSLTAASFVRPTRKPDLERTVLEAIQYKYGGISNGSSNDHDAVVISGKVAEEVGFDKIAKEQAQLSDLRIVLIDQLVVNGLAPRNKLDSVLVQAQNELFKVCPNITQLDVWYNTIETWQDIIDIASALPNLWILKAGGLRYRNVALEANSSVLASLRELHLDECQLQPDSIAQILGNADLLPNLEELHLSSNSIQTLKLSPDVLSSCHLKLRSLTLDNNRFADLECMANISKWFPNLTSVSLQANQITSIGPLLSRSKSRFPQIETLNIANNQINTFEFLDAVSSIFPNLSSLQISNNPLYAQQDSGTTADPRASEKSYFLTLARAPTLKSLNYVNITPVDRKEGELYYMSVAEKELKDLFSKLSNLEEFVKQARKSHPLYQSLTERYQRDSIIDDLVASTQIKDGTKSMNGVELSNEPIYPRGSIGARLVNATFYMPNVHSESQLNKNNNVQAQPHPNGLESPSTNSVQLSLPSTLPVSQVMSLLLRQPPFQSILLPLQFDLIYESTELDPVDTTTESTTRSAMYGKRLTSEQKRQLWQEWGDWDADEVVERARQSRQKLGAGGEDTGVSSVNQDHWVEDGKYLVRDGRKWKRREVKIPHSMKRAWGDWLDDCRVVRVRIERYGSISSE